MIYEDAESIESSRVDKDRHIACSYRVQLDAEGRLFPPENGWPEFHSASLELIRRPEYEYVVFVDISDFYNQVSHHRVENALELASVTRAKTIEKFLTALTAGQSRGLPVGSSASILLAEVCLNDVDVFLLRKGYKHVRYVDDFRIFCKSYYQAVNALHDLSEYLYTAHRLSVQPLKTRIVAKAEAIGEFTDPEAEERRSKSERIDRALEQLAEDYGPYADLDDLRDGIDEGEIAIESLSELFTLTLEQEHLHMGLARYLLRRAAQLRTSVICSKVFDNLDKLLPVLREVARYIRATRKASVRHHAKFIQLLESSPYRSIPFVQLWGFWILCECPGFASAEKALSLAEDCSKALGIRPAALVARAYRLVDWMRAHKETWANYGPWDRRAIIYSASVLPRDERNAWLDKVAASGDPLDRAIAQFVRAESDRTGKEKTTEAKATANGIARKKRS
jgi:hypothetical protein